MDRAGVPSRCSGRLRHGDGLGGRRQRDGGPDAACRREIALYDGIHVHQPVAGVQGTGFPQLQHGRRTLERRRGRSALVVLAQVGSLAWRHGKQFYNFEGLRLFKDKFGPEWSPRYLAVSGALGPYAAIADILSLISSSQRDRESRA